MLIRSGEAPAIGWSRNMLYSRFNTLPRSVVRRQTGFAARITRTLYGLNVTENPYQPPNHMPQDSSESEHRSFRLTAGSKHSETDEVFGRFRAAAKFALFQQIPLLILASLILDGGLIFKRVAIASVAFWILTLILMRHGAQLSRSDVLLVKWGYLPILLATCVMWMVGSAIMFPSP